MLAKIDLTDRKIISELDRNARISYTDLGRKLRISKETARYRAEQLEKKGIILGYYAIVDFSKIGFSIHRLYLRLQNASANKEKEIIDYLVRSRNVSIVYGINGPYHIALGVWAKNAWEYEDFWNGLRDRFGKYFSSCHHSVFTSYLEFSRPYLLEDKKHGKAAFVAVSRSAPEKLGETDGKILGMLCADGRSNIAQIASKTKAAIATVRSRMKKLQKLKVITGFRPMLNLSALGIEYYKVDVSLGAFENAAKIRQHIISHPNVTYAETSLASGDIEFDIEAKSFEEFLSIMNSFKDKFPEDIRDYTYYSRIKNYKTAYLPA